MSYKLYIVWDIFKACTCNFMLKIKVQHEGNKLRYEVCKISSELTLKSSSHGGYVVKVVYLLKLWPFIIEVVSSKLASGSWSRLPFYLIRFPLFLPKVCDLSELPQQMKNWPVRYRQYITVTLNTQHQK